MREHISQSFRRLLRDRGFTATALLTLMLCIGANSAVFSALNTLILRPMPFPDPERLVILFNCYPLAGSERSLNSVPDYLARREQVDVFEETAAMFYSGVTLSGEERPERIFCIRITPSLLPVLQTEPALGRNFTPEEAEPDAAPVVLLGHTFWRDRMGSDPAVVGRQLVLDGRSTTVVGVLPENFLFLDEWPAQLYLPVVIPESARGIENLHSNSMGMMARLRSDLPVEKARALAVEQVAAVNERLLDAWPVPGGRERIEATGFHTLVEDLKESFQRERRPVLTILMGGVVLVLLIGCVNIAHLKMTRLNLRRQELATRMALGADRRKLYQEMLGESLLLAGVGGLLSLPVTLVGIRLMTLVRVDELPFGGFIGLGVEVIGFTLLVTLAAAVIFGTIPVFQLLRIDLHTVFRFDGRTVTSGHGTMRYRSVLSVTQVALAFILMMGAGLLLTSLREVTRQDPGIEDPASILNGFIALPRDRYQAEEDRRKLADELLERVGGLPGVESAALTSRLPFVTFEATNVIVPEDYDLPADESLVSHRFAMVSPGYFKTMGIPLLTGRDFGESDGPGKEQVIIIDRLMAERYWPDSSPIGQRMVDDVPGGEATAEETFTVIGVVGAVKYLDLTEPQGGAGGSYYLANRQFPSEFLLMAVRTGLEPLSLVESIQKEVSALDPDLPFYLPTTLEQRITDTLAAWRIPSVLVTFFAGLALFLAAVGLLGVLSYNVTQRTREIGIRLALGDSSGGIFRRVLVSGLWALLFGLAIGVVGVTLLTGLIRGLLYNTSPTNPLVFLGVTLLLSVVTLLASTLPAWRATRVDPVEALNYE